MGRTDLQKFRAVYWCITEMYLFIHVPKVAGLSFKKLIGYENGVINYCGHTSIKDIHTLAFVRNPYKRLLDAYFYLMDSERSNPIDIHSQEILKQYPDFKTCVLNIEKDNLMDKIIFHFKPMHYWLCDENNNIRVDKIFKIEDIGAIDNFLIESGFGMKLSDIKINITEYGNYLDYLDAETIAEINTLYSLDFELFGYEKL